MTAVPASVTYIANIRLPTEKAHGLQIVRMCEAFAGAGAATTLIHPARHQPAGLGHADPFAYYGVRHPFRLVTLRNVDIVRAEPLLRFGLYTIAHFLHALVWGTYAVRAARRQAPAALYMTRDITTAVALSRARVPFVLEIHKAPERWSLRLLRRVVRSPSLCSLIVLTASLREALAARGVDVTRARVLHDGVDLERFAGAGARTDTADRVALYAGQLFEEKGIGVLIEAARLMPDVRVRIVGGMPQHVARWRAAAQGVPNLAIEGHVAPAEIPALQMSASVLLLPNSGRHAHSSLYTSPMKLFEYMAAGRPIVASDVPAIREVLRHDANAWLVAPDDPAALAEGVYTVLGDPALAARLAEQAKTDVRRYTWSARARAILEAT